MKDGIEEEKPLVLGASLRRGLTWPGWKKYALVQIAHHFWYSFVLKGVVKFELKINMGDQD